MFPLPPLDPRWAEAEEVIALADCGSGAKAMATAVTAVTSERGNTVEPIERGE
jgi:hypothetical protein